MRNDDFIETLDIDEPTPASLYPENTPSSFIPNQPNNNPPPQPAQTQFDIPQTFFRPIEQVQDQRNELLYQYQEQKGNIATPNVPDLTNEVKELEKQLQKKKLSMPFGLVLVIIVGINIIWFLGVQFIIVPKYDDYVKQSDEIKKTFDDLKRKVDALVGE